MSDRLFFFAVLFMISFPYTRAILPFVGEVNVKSHILLFLLVFSALKWLNQKKGSDDFVLKYSSMLFISYFCISITLGRELSTVAKQSFEYSPFIIACFIIATGTTIPYELAIRHITYAVALSGVVAAYIFYFNTQWMPTERLPDNAFAWGRLPWRNSYNLLIGLGAILFAAERPSNRKFLIFAVVVGSIPALLTFSRTFILTVILMFLVSAVYGLYRKKMVAQLQFFAPFVIACVIAITITDFENVLHNIEYRVIGIFTLSSDVSGDVGYRVSLYSQYFDVLATYPLFGAGFGVPFATVPKNSFYSDVTLVSFMLPFGVAGLVAFVLYVTKLWTMLNSVHGVEYATARTGMKVVLILALLVSFNDDLWTHKEFSIVIALVISSFLCTYRKEKSDSKYSV